MPHMARRSIPDEIRVSLAEPLARLARLEPFKALAVGTAVNDALLEQIHHVAEIRRAAVRRLRADGYTLKEIAEQMGVKIARVHQIEHGYDRREKQERASRT